MPVAGCKLGVIATTKDNYAKNNSIATEGDLWRYLPRYEGERLVALDDVATGASLKATTHLQSSSQDPSVVQEWLAAADQHLKDALLSAAATTKASYN